MTTRAPLRDRGLGTGTKTRLHRILHQHGLRNGTALFLPDDQGLEHGPRDSSANRESMEAGATGLLFGRNVRQRPHDESLRFVGRLRELLEQHPTSPGDGSR